MKKKVTIIDVGSGNILSIKRAFEKWDSEVYIAKNKEEILSSSRLVLPGVGAFKSATDNLKIIKFFEVISSPKFKDIPVLGICLGMQLLFEESEEFGKFKGLNLIKGKVKKLPKLSLDKQKLKIPSIGWHQLVLNDKKKEKYKENFFKNLDENNKFYFVHSYFAKPAEKDCILASYNFGGHLIPSIVAKNNIIGCQFHPEKSGPAGLNLIKNFLSL
jgi:imidazole glycerol-phosphate synthase subunit HisH